MSCIVYFCVGCSRAWKKHALRYEPSGDHLNSEGWLYNMHLFELLTGLKRDKCFCTTCRRAVHIVPYI